MKLPTPPLLWIALLAIAMATTTLAGCDGSDPADRRSQGSADELETAANLKNATPRAAALQRGERPAMGADKRDALLARADAAFEALGSGGRTRSESRIGPQPWPDDLPAHWPRLDRAQVLSDTRRQEGDRLLLVDLPDTPDHALDRYRQALEEVGFEVVRPRTQRPLHALHARRGADEVVLTFFGRERATRIEILFLDAASG